MATYRKMLLEYESWVWMRGLIDVTQDALRGASIYDNRNASHYDELRGQLSEVLRRLDGSEILTEAEAFPKEAASGT